MHMLRRDCAAESETQSAVPAQRQTPRPKPKADAPVPQPQSLPLLKPLLRNLSDRCILRVRSDFPGWDIYALKSDFDSWLDQDATREPKDYEAAFYGFVKQHHARNRHQVS